MKIIAISDTHDTDIPVPKGDVLVHAGDFSSFGTLPEAQRFAEWLKELPHSRKVVIAGNHDRILEEDPSIVDSLFGGIAEYLKDSSIVINGIKFYGSPYQRKYHNWAFNLSQEQLKKKWEQIPQDIDVLITHCPAYGILDRDSQGEMWGCPLLKDRIEKVGPKYHIFGHVHENYGMNPYLKTIAINASIMNKSHVPWNKPIEFEI